jgi:ATP-dependent Lon protease
MSECKHKFKSGKRKGLLCGKLTVDNFSYCKQHAPFSSELLSTSMYVLDDLDVLRIKSLQLDTSMENKAVIMRRLHYLGNMVPTSTEYHKNLNWLREALRFPYNRTVNLPVAIQSNSEIQVSEYVSNVYKKLDQYIYGMREIKEELMSFVCTRISNPYSTNHVLALHGNNGTGKTRLAYGLAHALDLPIRVINLGSVNDVSYLTGHVFTYVDSAPGRIIQILNETQCKNCIIYFDELDKIHHTEKGRSIYAFLTHLLDPTQNTKFQDLYLSDLEFDVSKVFFVFSYNDDNNVNKTVKDRLKVIHIEDPTYEDKIHIAEQFIVPEICKNINYEMKVERKIIEDVIQQDKGTPGLRNIRRILEDLISKMNVIRLLDDSFKRRMSYYHSSNDVMIRNIIRKHRHNSSHCYESLYL